MDVKDLIELLLEGRIRLKIEWDKIPVKCPYCDWSGEVDTPKQADMALKDHIRACPNEPVRVAFMGFIDDNS